MKPTANVLIGACVFALFCATGNDEAAAQSITVTPANPLIPVGQTQQFRVPEVSPAVDVAAGDYHVCAVLQNGQARCWGNNSTGQLGNGTVTDSSTPVVVSQVTQATAVTTGGFHSCAVLANGSVVCWGTNDIGQLGDGTTVSSATAVAVTGISTARAVTAGYHHTCALLQDGTVRCWGDNTYGQLGNGVPIDPNQVRGGPSTVHSSIPVTVSGINTAVSVAASDGYHTCAVLQNGTVRCWGDNVSGQLGDGSRSPSSTPVTVGGITNAIAVSNGDFHSCALLQDGTVSCWGLNYSGQLGGGTTDDSNTAVRVSGISTAVGVSAGVIHTCAVLQDGTARCWGHNSSGQLGDGGTTNSSNPLSPSGVTAATAITAGNNDSCAVLRGGVVQCWGMNTYGELGNGTTLDTYTPSTVLGISPAWTSSDPTVATIDVGGLATGAGAGSATITATFDGNSGSTTLTVSGQPVLAVVRGGTGRGNVTSSPLGIDCGSACAAAFQTGTVVTLTATPDGSTFMGWNGCDTASGTSCTVTMNASRSVTATFMPFTLTVTKAGTGTGAVTSAPAGIDCGASWQTCSSSFESGTQVTLTATPGDRSTFTAWTGCDTVSGNTCTVAMNAARSVTATFMRVRFTLTVNKTGVGRGTVTSTPGGIDCGSSCSAAYDIDTVVTLTATPAMLSVFTGWTGCDTVSDTTCVVRMSAAKSVTADFTGVPMP